MSDARGAVIEIVEKRRGPIGDSLGESTILPNEIRINGQSLLSPENAPVVVHEIALSERDLVQVTLTLIARRVEIKVEAGDE